LYIWRKFIVFCPEGYISIQDLKNRVSDFRWIRPENSETTYSDDFEIALFDFIYESESLRICSPSGVLLKIDDEILVTLGFGDGTITNDDWKSVGQPCGFSTVPLYFERTSYTISQTNSDFMDRLHSRQMGGKCDSVSKLLRRNSKVLQNFDGWALCVLEPSFLGEIVLNGPDDGSGDTPDTMEFPADEFKVMPKTEAALYKAIITHFDLGNFITKAEALDKLGAGFSARAFRRAWDRAAGERESLKVPGRRRRPA
jgi:hypothetical protein